MKPTDKPKRKINAPKRFGYDDDNKNKIIKNVDCSRCKIDITLNNIKYFELNNKLYCDLCYIDILDKPPTIPPTKPTITTIPTSPTTKPTITTIPTSPTTKSTITTSPTTKSIIPTSPTTKSIIPTTKPIIPIQPTIISTNIPKIKFIIMRKDLVNLSRKPNEKQDLEKQDLENPARKPSEKKQDLEKQDLENPARKPSEKKQDLENPNLINIINNKTQLLEKATPKNIAKNSNDEENDEEEEEEEEDYEAEEEEEEEEEENYEEEDQDEDEDETYNSINYDTTEFNNLFFTSILNRISNIDKTDKLNNKDKDKGCCGPSIVNNKQKNKGNKNKDDEKDDNDNNDPSLEYEWLGSDIKDIDDLIRIGKTYNPKKRKRHNLNLKKLNKLVEPLSELKSMIGMKEVKKIIFDQIIYYLQNLDDKNVDMLHTVIVGPPGVGKTQLTHIIAKIYNKLGFLKTDKVICAKRDDLIGEYIGQTAPKTRKILESALGGVLLLDEVYALSPNSERDFAREAIDMINVYLSEHCHDLVCVIAGYKKPTYENFLAHNEGLARRFTHHFEIKGYDAEELTLIFKKYLESQKWKLSSTVEEMKPIIEKNLKIFPNFGGDMTTLFACCKKTHSKRLLLIPSETELNNTKKQIHIDDIEKGIKLFIDIKTKGGEDELDKDKYVHMYS